MCSTLKAIRYAQRLIYNGNKPRVFLLVVPCLTNTVQYLLIWECLYFTSAMFVKCAISLTMLRVAAERSHKIALWVVIAFVIGTGLTGVIGGLTVCHPIEKNWDLTATSEDCAYDAVLVIGFAVTATSILTDFSCAGLPILVLWNMQMDRRTKVMTWVMLALGATYVELRKVINPYLTVFTVLLCQQLFEFPF